MKSNTCNLCGAKVLWLKSAKTGSWMALDPAPAPAGSVVCFEGEAVVIDGTNLFDQMVDEGPRYTPHVATCIRKKK